LPSHSHTGITLPASHDDNPDPPLHVSVIGNNFAGSATTYPDATTGAAGGGQAHLNVQPTLVTNFIIKL
jgi:microcystin-dependent protein